MLVAAAIVGEANQAAIAGLLDMATEHRRAAGLDRRHNTTLDPAEMTVVAAAERLAVMAEDMRQLQRATRRRRSGRGRDLRPQPVKRAWRAADGAGRHVRVAGRGVDVAMGEQGLE